MTTIPATDHSRFSLKEVFIASVLGAGAHVGMGMISAPEVVNQSFVMTSIFGAAVLASATEGVVRYLQGNSGMIYDLPTRASYMFTAGLGAMTASILAK